MVGETVSDSFLAMSVIESLLANGQGWCILNTLAFQRRGVALTTLAFSMLFKVDSLIWRRASKPKKKKRGIKIILNQSAPSTYSLQNRKHFSGNCEQLCGTKVYREHSVWRASILLVMCRYLSLGKFSNFHTILLNDNWFHKTFHYTLECNFRPFQLISVRFNIDVEGDRGREAGRKEVAGNSRKSAKRREPIKLAESLTPVPPRIYYLT